MTPNEYLDAAKRAMEITSDYELAKRLEISRQRVSAYRNGKEWPDAYIAAKLAITLELDPASVIADLEAQKETDPKRRSFWVGFLSRAAVVVATVCTLAWSFSGISEAEAIGLGGAVTASAVALFLARRQSHNFPLCLGGRVA